MVIKRKEFLQLGSLAAASVMLPKFLKAFERPRMVPPGNKVLVITDEVGLHPSLTCLKELYDDGSLGILNGVGYPNPDRSHFRSMDIWQTASESNQYVSTGWLGG